MDERERVQEDEAKGPPETDPRIAGEKHPVARMIGIGVFASLIGIAITLWIDWFPEPGSTSANKIDTLYDVLLICSVPVFVLVMTVAIYSVVRFRARPGDTGDGAPIHGNTRLEVIWVTIPFLMVTALAIYGWITLDDIEAKQPNEMVVNVTGQQFTWTFQYPDEKLDAKELVLPVDRPVEFRIHTKDVIHSFWVPQFRLKSDAVPGLTTHVRVTPDREGNFEVVCTELCGLGHSTMRQFARVVPAGAFRSWVADQKKAASGGATGGGGGGQQAGGPDAEQIFTSAGCSGCHTLAEAGATAQVGPDLGKLGKVSAAFIRTSIVDPNAKITKGYKPNIMPQDFKDRLSKEELDALVKYLLKAQG
ncbi:MAG: cytochrome c oxidase subunit II [Thermoleophilaceae bacterium]